MWNRLWPKRRDPGPGDDDPERGSAVLFVSLFGLVAVLAVLGLTGALVVEARAVNDSLAQVRAYWAAQGASAYVLSRIRYASPCPGATCGANPPAVGVAGYLSELETDFGTVTGAPSSLLWLYPESGSNYGFYLNASANPDNLAPTGRGGEFCLRFTVQALYAGGTVKATAPKAPGACSGLAAGPAAVTAPGPNQGMPIEALRSLIRTRPVEVRFCVVGWPGLPCGCTQSNKTTCNGSFNNSLLYQFVTSVHRPAS